MGYKKYIEENEEIRSGFKVSTNRKKVWNIQLGLLEELKRICKKYGLKYYADSGTLLGAIRHKGFIPRDDDIDLVMFRGDYEKFLKIANKELPNYVKLFEYHGGFYKLVNVNTTAISDNNRWDKDFMSGISIDIFPLDYASKYSIINWVKHKILLFLVVVLYSQKSYGYINRMKGWKSFLLHMCNLIFKKIDCGKVYKMRENISKKVIFKGNTVYSGFDSHHFLSEKIYDNSHNVKFENTFVNIPDGYDSWLKSWYDDYNIPVIYQGGHYCRFSVDKSYKDIIKSFDKSKSNEDNCKSSRVLFLL